MKIKNREKFLLENGTKYNNQKTDCLMKIKLRFQKNP